MMTRPNAENTPNLSLVDAAWQQVQRAEATTAAPLSEETRLPKALSALSAPLVDSLPGYTIQHEIHRGGQGVVYRAIQQSTNRAVAIKVMLGGQFAAEQQTARFEREIRILGQLRHPNIVTIHDSGSASGVAYFVMDYIDGRRFGEHLGDNSVSLPGKLAVFAQVCDAVHTAHLHGVIHRDLKPNNILVDAAGCPHILDFGLAKPVVPASPDHPSDEPTELAMTETGQFIGSLPWASPEQARGHAKLLDLRTDVYSLGVMLYQMLTGEFPYRVQGTLSDVVSAIVNDEPRSVGRNVHGDLATIALKALQKEPARRYQSAGELRSDIERVLAGEPIEARRASLWYLLRRRIARHRWMAVLSALLLLSIFIGGIASTVLWRIAEHRAHLAQAEATKAQAITQFLTDMIQSADPVSGGAAGVTVREAIDRATQRLDAKALAGQPKTEAALRTIIGNTYGALGQITIGREQLERARALGAASGAPESRESLQLLAELGSAYREEGRLDEAAATLDEALDSVRRRFGDRDPMVPRIMLGQAGIESDQMQLDAAEQTLREALALTTDQKDMAETHAFLLNDLALVVGRLHRHDEALGLQETAVTRFKEVLGESSFRTATSIANLANHHVELGDYEEAAAAFQEALALFSSIGGPQHPHVADCLDSMGDMYRKQGALAEALAVQREALAIRQAVLPQQDAAIARSLNNVGVVLYELGQFDESLRHMSAALEIMKLVHGPAHPSIAAMISNIAGIEVRLGRYEAAIEMQRQALSINAGHWGEADINTAASKHNLGQTLSSAGQATEAAELLREALATRRAHFGESHSLVASTADALAGALKTSGELDEAERLCRMALEIRERENPNSLATALSYHNLAGIFAKQDKQEQALQHADKAVELIGGALPADHWQIAWLRANRAMIASETSDPSSREELLSCLEQLKKSLGADHPHVTPIERALDAPER